MEIQTKFGPGPFRCLQKWHCTPSEAYRHLLPLGELDTITHPLPWVMLSKILYQMSLFAAPFVHVAGLAARAAWIAWIR